MKEDAEHNATVVGELAAKVAKPLTTSALTPDYRREMIRVFAEARGTGSDQVKLKSQDEE